MVGPVCVQTATEADLSMGAKAVTAPANLPRLMVALDMDEVSTWGGLSLTLQHTIDSDLVQPVRVLAATGQAPSHTALCTKMSVAS